MPAAGGLHEHSLVWQHCDHCLLQTLAGASMQFFRPSSGHRDASTMVLIHIFNTGELPVILGPGHVFVGSPWFFSPFHETHWAKYIWICWIQKHLTLPAIFMVSCKKCVCSVPNLQRVSGGLNWFELVVWWCLMFDSGNPWHGLPLCHRGGHQQSHRNMCLWRVKMYHGYQGW